MTAIPRFADGITGQESVQHCPYPSVPENLPSLDRLSGDDCRPKFVNIAIGIPDLVRHFRYLIMHITRNGVSFDVMDGLELPIVAECYVVWRLFRPTVPANRTEVFTIFLDDIYPSDVAAVRLLGSQGNDINHV